MMSYGYHMGGWGYALMGLNTLLFVALLIIGAFAMFRSHNHSSDPARSTLHRDTPEDLLAERYARGELNDDEFQHRRDTLRQSKHQVVDL